MTQFVLVMVGFKQPTPEVMEAWMSWFKSIGDKIVSQVGFKNGKEVSLEGEVKDLNMDLEALTGILTIEAQDMDEALEIAKGCPAITSTRVYEAMSHKG